MTTRQQAYILKISLILLTYDKLQTHLLSQSAKLQNP